jgi:N-acetylglutamate synthase-like GNAT family acetyltransferase
MSVEILEFKIKNRKGQTIGNITGDIFYNRKLVYEWLERIGAQRIRIMMDQCEQEDLLAVAVIQNIYVEPSERGKGYGSEALDQWLDDTHDVKFYLLELDLKEENDIDIEEWFERFGFHRMDSSLSGNPVMIMKSS